MSHRGDPPSAGIPLSGQPASDLLSAADAERLFVRHWAHPEASPEQHLLAALFDSAAAPATDRELTGEVAAVAAFVLAASDRAARARRSRRGTGRRARVITAGVVAASVVGFSGAATADALPGPIQELAHQTFGAPAPGLPGPSATSSPVPGRPGPVPGTGEATSKDKSANGTSKGKAGKGAEAKGKGNGNAQDKTNGQGKGKAQGQVNGQGNGKGNGATPSGQQKQSVSPSPGAAPSLGTAKKNWSPQHARPRRSALIKRYEPRHAYSPGGHRLSLSSVQNQPRTSR